MTKTSSDEVLDEILGQMMSSDFNIQYDLEQILQSIRFTNDLIILAISSYFTIRISKYAYKLYSYFFWPLFSHNIYNYNCNCKKSSEPNFFSFR